MSRPSNDTAFLPLFSGTELARRSGSVRYPPSWIVPYLPAVPNVHLTRYIVEVLAAVPASLGLLWYDTFSIPATYHSIDDHTAESPLGAPYERDVGLWEVLGDTTGGTQRVVLNSFGEIFTGQAITPDGPFRITMLFTRRQYDYTTVSVDSEMGVEWTNFGVGIGYVLPIELYLTAAPIVPAPPVDTFDTYIGANRENDDYINTTVTIARGETVRMIADINATTITTRLERFDGTEVVTGTVGLDRDYGVVTLAEDFRLGMFNHGFRVDSLKIETTS